MASSQQQKLELYRTQRRLNTSAAASRPRRGGQVMYYGTLPEADVLVPGTPLLDEAVMSCGHSFPRASFGASLSPKGLHSKVHPSYHLRDKQYTLSSK